METIKIYPIYRLRFWAAFWVHMRPYLLFISGIAGAAGMASSGSMALSLPAALGFLAFFLAYGFGQALTDCFQTDTDRLSAPYRPLSRGIVSPAHVGIAAVVGLVLVSGILIWLNILNLLFCLASIFGLATYSYVKRHFWWGGPFYNAAIVALLPVMGFLTLSGSNLSGLLDASLGYIVLLSFFSYTNFVLIGYLKDIEADAATGYRTFPVVFGWDAAVWAGDVFAGLSIAHAFLLCWSEPVAWLAFVPGSIVAVAGQLSAHRAKIESPAQAAFPIAATIRAFVLWHIAVVLAFRPGLFWIAAIYYVAFELTLWSRPVREQI